MCDNAPGPAFPSPQLLQPGGDSHRAQPLPATLLPQPCLHSGASPAAVLRGQLFQARFCLALISRPHDQTGLPGSIGASPNPGRGGARPLVQVRTQSSERRRHQACVTRRSMQKGDSNPDLLFSPAQACYKRAAGGTQAEMLELAVLFTPKLALRLAQAPPCQRAPLSSGAPSACQRLLPFCQLASIPHGSVSWLLLLQAPSSGEADGERGVCAGLSQTYFQPVLLPSPPQTA